MNQSLQPNLNYENDIIYVTKYSRWILMSIGIWPGSLKGSAKFLSKIAIGFGNLVLFFAIIPFSLHIVLEQKDTVIMLKMLGFLSFCLISVLKYWALAMRKPKIERCIELMQTDWKQVEFRRNRHMMLKYGKVGRDLTILCIVFMYSGGTIYHTIMQYAIGSFIDEHNRTIKPLVYPTYSALYDVQKIHVYVLVYTVHCMCGYVIYSVTAGACGLAALFATHTCGQIDIVLNRLNGLVDGNLMRHDDLNERLIEIVEHHLRTLRFSAMMETVLQEVCFLEFVGSTFMICLLEYYTIVSTSIGTSSFEIDWYRLPTKTIRGLILIIAMSNNPVKISAGGIVTLSLSTFVNVLKSSLGYLSFLRTVVV
ncbi:odorant receptor 13a-like isoform X4 [Megachile rotundata]|uniref:odorant receptor 13a-like isoform X4 n=1 Tax=Megachile rotundata TaxID=143995 RepID=UPI003FD358E1